MEKSNKKLSFKNPNSTTEERKATSQVRNLKPLPDHSKRHLLLQK